MSSTSTITLVGKQRFSVKMPLIEFLQTADVLQGTPLEEWTAITSGDFVYVTIEPKDGEVDEDEADKGINQDLNDLAGRHAAGLLNQPSGGSAPQIPLDPSAADERAIMSMYERFQELEAKYLAVLEKHAGLAEEFIALQQQHLKLQQKYTATFTVATSAENGDIDDSPADEGRVE